MKPEEINPYNTNEADNEKAFDFSDQYSKWRWMMDYCIEHKMHPFDFWDWAEKAWVENFEIN